MLSWLSQDLDCSCSIVAFVLVFHEQVQTGKQIDNCPTFSFFSHALRLDKEHCRLLSSVFWQCLFPMHANLHHNLWVQVRYLIWGDDKVQVHVCTKSCSLDRLNLQLTSPLYFNSQRLISVTIVKYQLKKSMFTWKFQKEIVDLK